MTDTTEPAAVPPDAPATVVHDDWGRVDVEGTVWLRTADGERSVGSWQAAEPEAGLAFFVRRFADLETQVALLEQRVASGAAAPDDAATTVRRLRSAVEGAQAVGDLAGLAVRLDGVQERVAAKRAERRAERAQALEGARESKDAIAAEAERIAESTDWRHGADRLRSLLERWKGLPRLDKPTDDALWRRFSAARTAYTRRRKAHYGEVAEQREDARRAKEELVVEAEGLTGSTEWGPTAGRYRDLMTRWKAAGHAGRDADEALWVRFRAAQDAFFAARNDAQSVRDSGQREALDAKNRLLAEAEALLPVRDVRAARDGLRAVRERWEDAGPVPRDAVRGIEARLRRVEEAVRDAERTQWQRSDPAARARASDTVAQLRSSISSLEAELSNARERGDERAAAEAQASLDARREWLVQAERALRDYSS